MGRGKDLTPIEIEKIKVLKEVGCTNQEIAKKIGRSRKVVGNLLKLGQNYGKKRKFDQNKKLTNRQKRQIFREVRKKPQTSSQICTNLNLPVSARRVRQILSSNSNLKYKKTQKKPPLTEGHKLARLQFAKKYMSWGKEWDDVVFSDEKKFNLDGPDGYHYYWHDLRMSEEVRMSRNFGGGSVMIWAAFSSHGKSDIAWITSRMNAVKYEELLEEYLLNMAENILPENFIFQQDNAAIHVAASTKRWFSDKNIPLLDWPARSPDLNPIENLWGIIARRVYANCRQFNSVQELKSAIKDAWDSITLNELQKLVHSMPNRIFETIKNKGGNTKY